MNHKVFARFLAFTVFTFVSISFSNGWIFFAGLGWLIAALDCLED